MKNTLKKIVALLLVMVFALTVSSCSLGTPLDTDEEATKKKETTQTEDITTAVVDDDFVTVTLPGEIFANMSDKQIEESFGGVGFVKYERTADSSIVMKFTDEKQMKCLEILSSSMALNNDTLPEISSHFKSLDYNEDMSLFKIKGDSTLLFDELLEDDFVMSLMTTGYVYQLFLGRLDKNINVSVQMINTAQQDNVERQYEIKDFKSQFKEIFGYGEKEETQSPDNTQKSPTECAHTYEESVVAPTYEKDGYTLHTCTKCGVYYTDSEVPKKEYSLKNYVLVDNASVKVTLQSITYENGDPGLNFLVENFTNKEVCFSIDEGSVNNFVVCPYWNVTVPAGKKSVSRAEYWASDLKLERITELHVIDIWFMAYYSNDYESEALVNENFVIYPLNENPATLKSDERVHETDEIVVASTSDFEFVILGADLDGFSYTYLVYFENKSDKTLKISWDDLCVNDFLVSHSNWIYLKPGKRLYDYMYLYMDDLEKSGITKVETVEFKLEVSEVTDYYNKIYENNVKFTDNFN